jgi:hypothetical protein
MRPDATGGCPFGQARRSGANSGIFVDMAFSFFRRRKGRLIASRHVVDGFRRVTRARLVRNAGAERDKRPIQALIWEAAKNPVLRG